MKQKFLRVFLFLLILAILLGGLSALFLPKGNRLEDGIQEPELYAFLGEPQNSLDVVVVGDSIPLCSFVPAYLWEGQGIPSYVCASTAQSAASSYFLLKAFFQNQKPKVVLYEADQLFLELSLADLMTAGRNGTLPVFRYHDNWKYVHPRQMLSEPDYTQVTPEKGYHMRKTMEGLSSLPDVNWQDTSMAPISQTNQYALRKTLELCRAQGAQLVLYSAPNVTGWSVPRHNALMALAEKLGIPYLDGNQEGPEIDWKHDTVDAGEHLNIRGAQKATQWLSEVLLDRWPLADKREDPAYAAWAEALEEFEARAKDPDLYW